MTVSEREALQSRVTELEADLTALDAERQRAQQTRREQHRAHLAALRQDLGGVASASAALQLRLREQRQLNRLAVPLGWRGALERGLLVGLWLGATLGCWLSMGPATGLLCLAATPAAALWGRQQRGRLP